MLLKAPWNERNGRFSPLKAVVFAALFAPALYILWRFESGALAPKPVTEMIHRTGDWAVRLLLLSLLITPLRKLAQWPKLIAVRRMVGVAAFAYAFAHFCLYIVDQKFDLLHVASEIVLRFYLTIGFVTLLGLLALSISSTDGWMRRLGPRWKKLHRLAYPLTVLALFHYYLQSKADVSAAVFVTGLFAWEMIWRVTPRASRLQLWPLPLIAVAAAVATALIEMAWYGLATRIDPIQVLEANLDLSYGPRPAVTVLLCGLVLCVIAWIRRWRQNRVVAA